MFPYEAMRRIVSVWATGQIASFKSDNSMKYFQSRHFDQRDPALIIEPTGVYDRFSLITNAVRYDVDSDTDYRPSFAIEISPKTFDEFNVDFGTSKIGTNTQKRNELQLNIGDSFLYHSPPAFMPWASFVKSHDQFRRAWNNWRYRVTTINYDHTNGNDTRNDISRKTNLILRDGVTGDVISDETTIIKYKSSIDSVEPFHAKTTNSNNIVITERIVSYEVDVSSFGSESKLIDTISYVWYKREGEPIDWIYDYKVIKTFPSGNFTIKPEEPDSIISKSTEIRFKYSRLVEALVEITNINQMKDIIGFPYL